MPADIIGTNVMHLADGTFHLHQGPVFTHLLLVDEVNRMPPRTQAALLECMEERQVTIDGARHQLSSFFTVFATQNPIDFEGTYQLPEAELDRFLVKIRVQYPGADEEVRLLANVHGGFDAHDLDAADLRPVPPDLLASARHQTRSVAVQESLFTYVVQLARRTRQWPALSLGASPRAAVSLMRFAQALAAIDGRAYVVPDDVKQAMLPVLRHRVIVRPEADLEGMDADQILLDVIRAVEVPR
jgi:MoxR-like ATPase